MVTQTSSCLQASSRRFVGWPTAAFSCHLQFKSGFCFLLSPARLQARCSGKDLAGCNKPAAGCLLAMDGQPMLHLACIVQFCSIPTVCLVSTLSVVPKRMGAGRSMTESKSKAQSLFWPWSDRMTGLLDGGNIELSSATALATIAMSHSSLQLSSLLEGRHQSLTSA